MRLAPWRWLFWAAFFAPLAAHAATSTATPASSRSPASAASVHLDAGALTASVAAALLAERPALVLTEAPAEATLRVRVAREAMGLRLSVEDATGAHLVERRIEGEEAAALRMVVLLVSEASDARGAAALPPDPGPEPTPTPTPAATPGAEPAPAPAAPRAWHLRAGAHVSAATWSGPATLTLGFGLGVALELSRVRVDLRGTVRPCCGVEDTTVVRATPLGVEGSAEAALEVLHVGPVALSPTAGVAAAWRRVDGVALAYAGPAPEESQAAPELSLVVGALGAWAFSAGWQLEARAALEVRATRLRVSLPPPYAGGENAIDPGIVSGRLDLAITAPIL